MATTLRFVITGDDQASKSFDRFARSIDNANQRIAKNNAALKQQSKSASDSQASMGGLTASILGFGGASKSAGKDGSAFQKVLLGLNVATGVLEPALAGVIVAAGGLGAGLAAAGVGAGVFGAVAKAALTTAAAAAKKADAAQAAYTASVMKIGAAYTTATGKATTAAQRQAAITSKQTSLQGALATRTSALAAAYDGLSAPQIRLGKAIQAAKDQWNAFISRATPGVAGVMVKAFGLLPAVFKAMLPFLAPVEKTLDVIISRVQAGLASPAWARFVAMMSGQAGPALLAVATDAGNLGRGLAGILTAFMPMSSTILGGTEKLTAAFARWGQSLPSHSGFQALMATFRGETPQAVAVLKNLAVVLKNVADDMTGLATPANSRALLNILQPLSQLLVTATNNRGLVEVALYLLAIRSAARQVSGPVHSVGSAFDSLKDSGTKVLAAVTAVRGFSSAAVAAAGVQKSLAAATAIDTAATTAFAVASDGTTTSVVAMSLAEKAAAVTGAALAAVNPVVWAVAAVAAAAIFTVEMIKLGSSVQATVASLQAQYHATGFNISGYQKLAGAATTMSSSQQALGDALDRTGTSMVAAARGGGGTLVQSYQAVTQASSQAAVTGNRLVGQLGELQIGYQLTQKQAEQLAVKAGVSAQQLAASGNAGQQALAKVIGWANGAGQATIKADQWANQTNGLTAALQGLADGLLTAQGNELGWQSAVDNAKASLANSTAGLQGNSAAAVANRQSILQSTIAAVQYAQSQDKLHGNIQSASSVLQAQIKFLQSTGDKSSFVTTEIDALRTALAKLKDKSVNVKVQGDGSYFIQQGGGVGHPLAPGGTPKAAGGLIRGPGGPTADKAGIYALSNKEYVVKAAAVQKYGVKAMDAINAGRMAAGGIVGKYSGPPAPGEANWITADVNATTTIIEQATAKAAATAIKAAQKAAAAVAGAPGGAAIGAGAAAAQAYAKSILHDYGWGLNMFPPLQSLWNGESGWNYKAYNASSGATGIPQSLPGSKMASAGADWRTNPATQIRWGMGYIKGRYSNPATAYSDWLARSPHWYATGTGGAAPGWGVAGERGRELIHFRGGETVLPNSMTNRVLSGSLALPGYAAGTLTPAQKLKNQRLAELAADVVKVGKLNKARDAVKLTRGNSVVAEELYVLKHPRDKAAPKKLAAMRKAFSAWEATTLRPISLLDNEINLLRVLTGHPAGVKYAGPPPPAPDTTSDDTSGDSTGGSSSPSGPAPGIPVTTQVDISAAAAAAAAASRRAGRSRWGPAYAGGRRALPGSAWSGWLASSPQWDSHGGPAAEPLAGIGLRSGYRAGQAGGPGGDYVDSMIDEIRGLREDVDAMHKGVAGEVRKVGPAAAAGVSRSLNGMARGVVGG